MSVYDWSQFHVRMYYLADLHEVFKRFATERGLESFFIYSAEHRDSAGGLRQPDELVQSGDQYHWIYVHDYEHGGKFDVVEQNRLLSFTFGSMHVAIRFKRVGGATEVELHQTNCATQDPDRVWQHLNCRSCWVYFLTNLRSVLAGGPDVRDFAHPLWNDSISVGFDPLAGPGEPRQQR